MDQALPTGFSWVPQFTDKRDLSFRDQRVQRDLAQFNTIPDRSLTTFDIRTNCDERYLDEPINTHNGLSSPSIACLSAIEYGERRFLGKATRLSPSFVYRMSVKMLGLPIGSWIDIRNTWKAIKRFGSPPCHVYASNIQGSSADFDSELAIGYAREFDHLRYFGLHGENGSETLSQIKLLITSGLPVVFGFPVPNSTSMKGVIPYRPDLDGFHGGHAAIAYGFDDNKISRGQGALLINPNWGSRWGDNGFGWLPYKFVTSRIASDFWGMIDPSWATNTSPLEQEKA